MWWVVSSVIRVDGSRWLTAGRGGGGGGGGAAPPPPPPPPPHSPPSHAPPLAPRLPGEGDACTQWGGKGGVGSELGRARAALDAPPWAPRAAPRASAQHSRAWAGSMGALAGRQGGRGGGGDKTAAARGAGAPRRERANAHPSRVDCRPRPALSLLPAPPLAVLGGGGVVFVQVAGQACRGGGGGRDAGQEGGGLAGPEAGASTGRQGLVEQRGRCTEGQGAWVLRTAAARARALGREGRAQQRPITTAAGPAPQSLRGGGAPSSPSLTSSSGSLSSKPQGTCSKRARGHALASAVSTSGSRLCDRPQPRESCHGLRAGRAPPQQRQSSTRASCAAPCAVQHTHACSVGTSPKVSVMWVISSHSMRVACSAQRVGSAGQAPLLVSWGGRGAGVCVRVGGQAGRRGQQRAARGARDRVSARAGRPMRSRARMR